MVRKIDTLKRLRLFGDFLMLGTFLLLLWLFISAYLSGFSTTVHINNYGEAHVEMIILVFFLLPLFLVTTALSFLDWRQTWKAKGKILNDIPIRTYEPNPYENFVEESLICPECGSQFIVKGPNAEGMISCPMCGVRGWYSPIYAEKSHDEDRGPEVKIIKNIRQ
ncbi:MAG: hypothetical protein JSV09_02400 [Thermoplasmata archaeon]|nr:MAG: hypothetical protein JSV09_02400 [Thermoplasmata archaeon]